jgi:predicted AAA+ superfamily ATPase
MIPRVLARILKARLAAASAVVLLGARQTGKTTLAHLLAQESDCLYLDLESPRDLALLAEPELYLEPRTDRLVILDEVHRMPELFPVLRGLIDRARWRGKTSGMYLLLGSASLDLLRHSGESLAGRVSYLELNPVTCREIPADSPADALLWLRGGFPESLLAATEAQSLRWRQDFVQTYLERELPRFGAALPGTLLRRLWTMLAHGQGGLQNSARLAASLGIDVRTVNGYLDILEGLFLLRRLPPWHANTGKRLVKAPKLYLRDSGLVHALLGIADMETLLAHPVAGPSWEGFIIDQILALLPHEVQPFFYRTGGGAELDLLLSFANGKIWAIEIKRSLVPKAERGFHASCADLEPERRIIVYPGERHFPLGDKIEVVPLRQLLTELPEMH